MYSEERTGYATRYDRVVSSEDDIDAAVTANELATARMLLYTHSITEWTLFGKTVFVIASIVLADRG